MKAYIASPFFNEKQSDDVTRVEEACKKAYWNYYSPRNGKISEVYNALDESKPEDVTYFDLYKKMVFMEDIIEIDTSDVIFVNYNGKDSGTLFELGYALYKKKRIICSCTDEVERREFDVFLRRIKDIISNYEMDDNLIICHECGIQVHKHDLDPSTIIVVAEHGSGYKGVSKVILGYLYAYSECHKEIDVTYIDVPRKSNLMLTGSSTVYECTDLTIFDIIKSDQYNHKVVSELLDTKCTLIKDSKDE